MKCSHCHGTGVIDLDPATLKTKRIRAGLSQIQAAQLMEIYQQHLSDLETGRRDWDAPLLRKFAATIAASKRKAK